MKARIFSITILVLIAMASVSPAFASSPAGAASPDIVYIHGQAFDNDIFALDARLDGPSHNANLGAGSTYTATIPQETIDALTNALTSGVVSIFTYAVVIIGPLMAVAAIGIGFKFGGRLVEWVGSMIGSAIH